MYRSKDFNLPFLKSTGSSYNKHGKEESDLPLQIHQMNSGLLRYRSAPTSFIANLCEEFLPHRPASPDATESMFARFMTEKPPSAEVSIGQRRSRTHLMMPAVAEEAPTDGSGDGGGGIHSSSSFQMLFHSPKQEQIQQSIRCAPATIVDGPYRLMGSIEAEAEEEGKNDGRSSLIRQSSSPTGFLSHLNVENGFGHGGSSNAESSAGTNGRLKGQMSYHSNQSSSAFMSQTSDTGNNGIGDGRSSPQDDGGSRCYLPGYHLIAPWEDTVLLSENFAGSKRPRDLSECGGDMRSHISSLTRHLSLPKSSSEMSAMDIFFQIEDAVPCKIRAKRGCATHPRSIAERVRRTKISERIRKLQEVVPNLDKQTNTSDMLDLSVEYIKELQNTVKTLSDDRSRCTCSSKQKTRTKTTLEEENVRDSSQMTSR